MFQHFKFKNISQQLSMPLTLVREMFLENSALISIETCFPLQLSRENKVFS